MRTETPTLPRKAQPAFPLAEVERRLRDELQQAAEESQILHNGWEPELDSLRMVSVVLTLEDLFGFSLPPDKLVQRGGYRSVEEGVADIRERLQSLWNRHARHR